MAVQSNALRFNRLLKELKKGNNKRSSVNGMSSLAKDCLGLLEDLVHGWKQSLVAYDDCIDDCKHWKQGYATVLSEASFIGREPVTPDRDDATLQELYEEAASAQRTLNWSPDNVAVGSPGGNNMDVQPTVEAYNILKRKYLDLLRRLDEMGIEVEIGGSTQIRNSESVAMAGGSAGLMEDEGSDNDDDDDDKTVPMSSPPKPVRGLKSESPSY